MKVYVFSKIFEGGWEAEGGRIRVELLCFDKNFNFTLILVPSKIPLCGLVSLSNTMAI